MAGARDAVVAERAARVVRDAARAEDGRARGRGGKVEAVARGGAEEQVCGRRRQEEGLDGVGVGSGALEGRGGEVADLFVLSGVLFLFF